MAIILAFLLFNFSATWWIADHWMWNTELHEMGTIHFECMLIGRSNTFWKNSGMDTVHCDPSFRLLGLGCLHCNFLTKEGRACILTPPPTPNAHNQTGKRELGQAHRKIAIFEATNFFHFKGKIWSNCNMSVSNDKLDSLQIWKPTSWR